MVLGFTGSGVLGLQPQRDWVTLNAYALNMRLQPTGIVTGACVGVDAFVHHFFHETYPEVHRTVVVPANRRSVDTSVLGTANTLIECTPGTSYRHRNTRMVELSDQMAAFWHGAHRSGTFMTMNIAHRAGKMPLNNLFGHGLTDAEVRRRFMEHLA